jgi:eukaryotic-like serine/threonine-protein kinase
MPLTAGAKLGPFEILAPIGAGGMGEVYRARDTRLDRTVAIKILPDHLYAAAPARERFEREAKAISSLNHPHICTLHDVGHHEGIDFLVMEYLEGQSLADRLKKGPLPLEQVLQYAIEITAALDTAHKHGVIHRDLKPGNIVLTKTGAKLLDFGLAKLRATEADGGLTAMVTQTTPLTGEGTILGTLQYMAPEQLEGADADARTDLFALGAVIYEMVTGRKAFEGRNQASLISAIMTAQPPPISSPQTLAPPLLDHIVRTCLIKDPDARWQTAHDIMVELKWIAEGGSQAGIPAPVVTHRKGRELLAWALALAAAFAFAYIAMIHLREKPPEAHPVRFLIQTPPYLSAETNVPVIAPNGLRFVFPATNAGGKNLLWLRSLDSPSIRPIAGTEDAIDPFWSPDSRFIGFFAQGKLKKIDPSGGPPQILCDVPDTAQWSSRGGSWNKDGVILFGTNSTLVRLSAQGGELKPVHELDKPRREVALSWPRFMPDGNHFLYDSFRPSGGSGIYLGSLDSKETRLLVPNESNVNYVLPGFLIYGRQDTLFAQPFDADKFRVTGEPIPVADQLAVMRYAPGSVYSVSQNGVLVYRGVGSADVQLAWYNRDGKRLGPVGQPGAYGIITLSPDEKRVALERFDAQLRTNDLWTLELASGIFSRLTFNPADETDPVWSPDGRELVFSSNRQGATNLYRKVIGGGDEELVLDSAEQKYPKLWMKDGSILFISAQGKTFYHLPLVGDRKPVVLTHSEFDRDNPRISPDGHWIAYNSLESGRWEVYVAAFPSFQEKRQVSGSGGCQPLWRKDGTELFYRTLEGKQMVVEVKTGSKLQTGVPLLLFQTPARVDPVQSEYAVTGDGKMFLFREPVGEGTAPITVVLNWSAGLKR